MVKLAKKYGEDCKVSIRNARREANSTLGDLKDEGEASEDDVERAKKKVDEIVSAGTKQVDGMMAAKEKDILEV